MVKYTIRTQIEIEAPASAIWEILIDLDRYHEWNPFIIQAQGRIAEAASIRLLPLLAEKRQVSFDASVTRFVEGKEFAWTGAIVHRFFAKGEHIFRLTKTAAGRVRLDHDEVFFGPGGWLVGLIGAGMTRRGFEAMNRALKQKAEAMRGL